jgi:hypothetical protein
LPKLETMKARAARPGSARRSGARAVEHHVLVDLVADQQHVGGRQQVFELAHVRGRPDGGAGVVRAVDDQRACAA